MSRREKEVRVHREQCGAACVMFTFNEKHKGHGAAGKSPLKAGVPRETQVSPREESKLRVDTSKLL